MQLGEYLRKMRKEAGLSQEDMAHALHMSISNISRFETNKYDIRGIDLIRWCRITNNPDMLMSLYMMVDVASQMPVTEIIVGAITVFGGLIG